MLSLCGHTDAEMDGRTTVKQYAADLSIRGHKNIYKTIRVKVQLQNILTGQPIPAKQADPCLILLANYISPHFTVPNSNINALGYMVS